MMLQDYLDPGIPEKIAMLFKAIPGPHHDFLTWTGDDAAKNADLHRHSLHQHLQSRPSSQVRLDHLCKTKQLGWLQNPRRNGELIFNV
jgi:hypothetical protein